MANHLIIGLGGTGGSILCALRKRIYEEFRSNEPNGKSNIEYLYVDSSLTDLNNESKWRTLGASVQLSPAQRLSINGIGTAVLDELEQYPGIHSFINRKDQAMLQEGIGAIINEGIGGQRRRFGRMLIANNMCGIPEETFVGQVHARVNELKTKENVEDVTFHICAGLGGGTGSGSIVDAVTQIRNEFQRTGDDRQKFKIQLYLYVPEKIIKIRGGEASNRYYQPNGYAALLELNAMSVRKFHPTDVKGTTDEDGKVKRLLTDQDAFDMAYLFSNVNEAGKEADLQTVLPGIVGDFLFQKVVASSLVDGGEMVRLVTSENNGLLPENDESGESVHSRKFMTFGVKRIEYPETEVVEYSAYHYARQASMQMLYGLWDDARGFLDECTEDMVGKSYKQDVAEKDVMISNLTADDYVTLSIPLPSIEKNVKNWKPIIKGWEFYVDEYKLHVQEDKKNKEKWLEQFSKLCEKYYDSMWRGCGVEKFYQDYETEISGFAEEICRKIENNLFTNWKNGNMSIIEVHKYINVLVVNCEERIEDFKTKIGKRSKYLEEDLARQIKNIHHDWNDIGWLKDTFTSAPSKVLGRFADAKKEQLTLRTQIKAYTYATKLLSEVATMLTVLNSNAVEPFMKVLIDFADAMKTLADSKCKLSDADERDVQSELIKEYDPKMVRRTVAGFLKNQQKQKEYATGLRTRIIESVSNSEVSFSMLGKRINQSALLAITFKTCIENSRKDMEEYSVKNPNQKLVKVNILDKLRNSECSTDEKMKAFAAEIYGAAQSFLTFNSSEKNKGSHETAANHKKMIQLSLPLYDEDPEFRDTFIKVFGESGSIPFKKDQDVSVNPFKNQIVVVTAHSGFPLRYVDNVRVLKEKYDVLVRSDVNRMVVHTESFAQNLPSLFNKSGAEARKSILPVLLLAYTIDGIIVEREDLETGERTKEFATEKNKMGKLSGWIRVGENIIDSLDVMSKVSRTADAKKLRAVVENELTTNYKHIDKRNALMLKMGEFLDAVLESLCGGNEKNPQYVELNNAAEKLCDKDLQLD